MNVFSSAKISTAIHDICSAFLLTSNCHDWMRSILISNEEKNERSDERDEKLSKLQCTLTPAKSVRVSIEAKNFDNEELSYSSNTDPHQRSLLTVDSLTHI